MPGADVACVVLKWLQSLKNKLEGSTQDEENDDQEFLRSLFAAKVKEEKACESRAVKEFEERTKEEEQDGKEFQDDP